MQKRRSLNDIWSSDSEWQKYARHQLELEGLHHSTALYWNPVDRVLVWMIPRSEPRSERYEGNFPVDRRTLQYCVRAKRDPRYAAAAVYIGTKERNTRREYAGAALILAGVVGVMLAG